MKSLKTKTRGVPDIKSSLKTLFTQKWIALEDYQKLTNGKYPGVYLLAYTNKNMMGKRVAPDHVYYVGMSRSRGGIYQRLYQYKQGIENGKSHSAAIRFFHKVAKGKPYSRLPNKKKFYVASISIPCVVDKSKRTAFDLKKMGEVARLEYYALAHIKNKRFNGSEPWLNKQ
jgi:hypothetical protein